MMNPYAFPNLLRPNLQPVRQLPDTGAKKDGLDLSLSRAAYRLVGIVERLISKGQK